MIELLILGRCTGCNECIRVCPTNLFQAVSAAPPIIARQDDCQTCFMCELYCRADALYVGPDFYQQEQVTADQVIQAGHLGQFPRHSGWHEWEGLYPNRHWRMDAVFMEARKIKDQ